MAQWDVTPVVDGMLNVVTNFDNSRLLRLLKGGEPFRMVRHVIRCSGIHIPRGSSSLEVRTPI